MKIAILAVGVLLQCIALYIAFYSHIPGNIYLATLVSVVSICCLITIRSLFAPACLLAGILVGLSLSHNQVDLQFVTQWEKQLSSVVRADFVKTPEQSWNLSNEQKLTTTLDDELVIEASINAPE